VEPSRSASPAPYAPPPEPGDRLWLHLGLFVATFASMVYAGGTLAGRAVAWEAEGAAAMWLDGLRYAVPFIVFLTVHEFGHYLMARRHRIRVSLPFYIPVPLAGSFGTFGAVIRIKEPIRRTRQLFDIGAAGPLAGFVVALATLLVAVWLLPPVSYLNSVGGHDALVATVEQTGVFPPFDAEQLGPGDMAFRFGDTPLFLLVSQLGDYVVPDYERFHYPVLLAAWLGLFFTALNLLPVGQLDGGHVVYAMFGPTVHAVVARMTVLILLLSAALGFVGDTAPSMGLDGWRLWAGLALVLALALAKLFEGDWILVAPSLVGAVALVAAVDRWLPALRDAAGYSGWFVWIALILFVIRVDHPPVLFREPLTARQKALGWLCIVLFGLCFSVKPITIVGGL
jgi:membrane-associated protease RseP (regulator of RpoE activity)